MVTELDLQKTICPVPNGERGYGTHVGSVNTGKLPGRVAFGSQNIVWVREVENPLNCFPFRGHIQKVNCARWSPLALKDKGGGWIASGDEGGNYKVWTCRADEPVTKLEGKCGKMVKDISWQGDGKKVYVCGMGKEEKGKAADWATGNQYGYMTGNSKTILSCDGRPKRPWACATGSEDPKVNFYSKTPIKLGHCHNSTHHKFVNCVRYSNKGDHFVSVSSDKLIVIWDGRSGEEVDQIQSGHTGSIYSVAWSPDDTRFVTGSADKTMRIWDFESRECIAVIDVMDKLIEDMLAGVNWVDNTIIGTTICGDMHYVDGSEPNGIAQTVCGHKRAVKQLCVAYGSEDGDVYSICQEKVMRTQMYTGQTRRYRGTPHGRNTSFVQLGLNADHTMIVTVAKDDHLIRTPVDDVNLNEEKMPIGNAPSGASQWLVCHTVDPNFTYVCGSRSGIRVFNGNDVAQDVAVDYEPLKVASMSKDGTKLLVGARKDGQCYLVQYAVEGGMLGDATELRNQYVRQEMTGMKFSPDNLHVALIFDRRLQVFNTESFEGPTQRANLSFQAGTVKDIDFHENGVGFISAGADRCLLEYDDVVANHTHQFTENAHLLSATCVKYLNHEVIVSAGGDGSLKMWLRG